MEFVYVVSLLTLISLTEPPPCRGSEFLLLGSLPHSLICTPVRSRWVDSLVPWVRASIHQLDVYLVRVQSPGFLIFLSSLNFYFRSRLELARRCFGMEACRGLMISDGQEAMACSCPSLSDGIPWVSSVGKALYIRNMFDDVLIEGTDRVDLDLIVRLGRFMAFLFTVLLRWGSF